MPSAAPPSTSGSLRAVLAPAGEGLVEAAWLACALVVPLVANVYADRPFEPAKTALLQSLVVLALCGAALRLAAGTGRPAGLAAARGPLLAAAALAAALALSAALSIDPRLSLMGSYDWDQGLVTRLAGLALFVCVVVFLRRRDQMQRLLVAIVLASVPVALLALLQQLGFDPWQLGQRRPGSTLGNPIFLGGYLAMAALPTLDLLARALRERRRAQGGPQRRAATALAAALALQLLALAGSQSRGPLVGLAAGLAVYLPALALAGRAPGRRRRAAALAAAAVLLLPLTAVAASRGWLPRPGFLERLGETLELDSRTVGIRLALWRDGLAELRDREPLGAGGEDEPGRGWRPLAGLGLETLPLVLGRSGMPAVGGRQAVEARAAHSHNEGLDRMLETGVAGTVAWLAVWVLLAGRGLAGLGLGGGRQLGVAAVAVAAGGTAGGLAGPLLGRTELAVATAPLAAAAGLAAVVWIAAGRRPPDPDRLGIAALLAGLVVHFVEIQFAFQVTSTGLLFWLYAGALCAATGAATTDRGAAEPAAGLPAGRPARAHGLLAALALAPVVLVLLTNWEAAAGAAGILAQALDPRLLVPLAVLAVALLLAGPSGAGERRHDPTVLLWALLPAAAYGLHQLLRLLHAARLQAAAADLAAFSGTVAGHFPTAAAWVLAATTALAALLANSRAGSAPAKRRRATVAITVLVGAGSVWLAAVSPWLAAARAGTLAKHAGALAGAGNAEAALHLLGRAVALRPREPALELRRGAAALRAARTAGEPRRRDELLQTATDSAAAAIELSPLDSAARAALGRARLARADSIGEPVERRTLLLAAHEAYRQALALRPGSPRLLAEAAAVLARLGEPRAAESLLERAIELAPAHRDAYLLRAALLEAEARALRRAGDAAAAADALRAAIRGLAALVERRPEDAEAGRTLRRLRAVAAAGQAWPDPPG